MGDVVDERLHRGRLPGRGGANHPAPKGFLGNARRDPPFAGDARGHALDMTNHVKVDPCGRSERDGQ